MLAHFIRLPQMTAGMRQEDAEPLTQTEFEQFEKRGAKLGASQIDSIGCHDHLQKPIMCRVEVRDAFFQRLLGRRRDTRGIFHAHFWRRVHGAHEPVSKPSVAEGAMSCKSFFACFRDTGFECREIDFVPNGNVRQALRHGPLPRPGMPIILSIAQSSDQCRSLFFDLRDLAFIVC